MTATDRTSGRARPHGTAARYCHGPDINDQPGKGCRCRPCRDAQTERLRAYRRRKALERWGAAEPVMVDADPVRAHVRALMEAGIGWEHVAQLAGVTASSVSRLLYGNASSAEPPSRRMYRATANKLLAVSYDTPLADGSRLDATGTRRRLQALVAVGYPGSELMRRIGKLPINWSYLLKRERVTAATARAVAALYDELWDQPPPEATDRQRAIATAARNRARARGWPPPMAWNDGSIDHPAAQPELGETIPRRLALCEDSEELLRQGFTLEQAAERLGVSKLALAKVRERVRKAAA